MKLTGFGFSCSFEGSIARLHKIIYKIAQLSEKGNDNKTEGVFMGTFYVFAPVGSTEYLFQVERNPSNALSFLVAANDEQTFPLNTPAPASLAAAQTRLFDSSVTAANPPDQTLLTAWDLVGTDAFLKSATTRVNDLVKNGGQTTLKRGVVRYMDQTCEASLGNRKSEAETLCSYVKDDPATPGLDEIFLTNFTAKKAKANDAPSDGNAADALFFAGTRVLNGINSP
jgi:hypothetical protein